MVRILTSGLSNELIQSLQSRYGDSQIEYSEDADVLLDALDEGVSLAILGQDDIGLSVGDIVQYIRSFNEYDHVPIVCCLTAESDNRIAANVANSIGLGQIIFHPFDSSKLDRWIPIETTGRTSNSETEFETEAPETMGTQHVTSNLPSVHSGRTATTEISDSIEAFQQKFREARLSKLSVIERATETFAQEAILDDQQRDAQVDGQLSDSNTEMHSPLVPTSESEPNDTPQPSQELARYIANDPKTPPDHDRPGDMTNLIASLGKGLRDVRFSDLAVITDLIEEEASVNQPEFNSVDLTIENVSDEVAQEPVTLEPVPVSEQAPQIVNHAMWNEVNDANLGRVAALEQSAIDLMEGDLNENSRRNAKDEAHKLAEVLGTVGLSSGSAVARDIEGILEGDDLMSLDQTRKLTELVVTLENLIYTGPPVDR